MSQKKAGNKQSERKAKKLTLKKKTIKDLKAKNDKIRGGGYTFNKCAGAESDRNLKDNFQDINTHDILNRVAAMPIQSWSYKDRPGIRHIGPMAQDFAASFHCGEDDRHIRLVDAAGVAFAAIQALSEQLVESRREISELRAELHSLKKSR